MSETQSTVEYREIKGHPGYRVGSDGSVWSCRSHGGGKFSSAWHKLRPAVNPQSKHLYVNLMPGPKRRPVHQLVLEAFVGEKPIGCVSRHFPDRNPSNNKVENLQWGTPKQNVEDMIFHGTINRGAKHHLSKLTAEQVVEIRKEYKGKLGDLTRIAKKHGVTKQSIREIVMGTTWKHTIYHVVESHHSHPELP